MTRITSVLRTSLIALFGLALVGFGPPPEGFEHEPDSEHIFLGIGCNRSGDAPSCDSTEYWLGLQAGEDNVGTTFTASPVNEVRYLTGDPWTFGEFFADETLQDSYILRTDEPIAGQVTLGGFIGGATFGVDSTIKVEIFASEPDSFSTFELGEAEATKLVATPDDTVYEFEIELDEERETQEVEGLWLRLHVRGVNVLQNGFVNGSGGSWFDLPHYDLVETDDGEGTEAANEEDGDGTDSETLVGLLR